MKRYFNSRHPGAIEWAAAQDLRIDQFLPHLDLALVQAGDVVMGSPSTWTTTCALCCGPK